MAFWSSLDDDSQGAQFLAPKILNRALPKRGPCYAFPEVHAANGPTRRGAVLLPPGKSTKCPSLLSYRYFLTPLNTCDSINCFKLSLSLSLAALFLMPTPNSAEDFFKRARERGAENEMGIINDEEIKKELQPGAKNNYRRALTLWPVKDSSL